MYGVDKSINKVKYCEYILCIISHIIYYLYYILILHHIIIKSINIFVEIKNTGKLKSVIQYKTEYEDELCKLSKTRLLKSNWINLSHLPQNPSKTSRTEETALLHPYNVYGT